MAYRRAALVAVLADVHGNLPALSAVLAEPDVAAADAVVLLGDIALGPMPAQTLEVLAGLGERAIWVHGNCEREMVAAFDGVTVPGPNGPQASASAALIGRRHRDMLDRLPLAVTLEIDGLGVCGFCHASPRRDDEMLLVDSPVQRWDAALSGLGAEVGTVVCGHTHMPFDRLAAGRRVVNPGSVGMPYGPPGAHWALLGQGIWLRRTRYDTAAATEVIQASGYPDGAAWSASTCFTTTPIPRPSRRSPRSPASRKARRGNRLICAQLSSTATRLTSSWTAGPGHPAQRRVNHAPLPGTAGHATPIRCGWGLCCTRRSQRADRPVLPLRRLVLGHQRMTAAR